VSQPDKSQAEGLDVPRLSVRMAGPGAAALQFLIHCRALVPDPGGLIVIAARLTPCGHENCRFSERLLQHPAFQSLRDHGADWQAIHNLLIGVHICQVDNVNREQEKRRLQTAVKFAVKLQKIAPEVIFPEAIARLREQLCLLGVSRGRPRDNLRRLYQYCAWQLVRSSGRVFDDELQALEEHVFKVKTSPESYVRTRHQAKAFARANTVVLASIPTEASPQPANEPRGPAAPPEKGIGTGHS
jgi:hypothetical protein